MTQGQEIMNYIKLKIKVKKIFIYQKFHENKLYKKNSKIKNRRKKIIKLYNKRNLNKKKIKLIKFT